FNYASTPGFSYSFSYGDNTNGSATTHSYSANGVYTATLFAINPTSTPGCSVNASQTFTVNSICSMSVSISLSLGNNGHVSYTANVSGSPLPTGFLWKLGDGSTSPFQTSAHTYSANGIYLVYLKDSTNWCSAVASVTFPINNVSVTPCNLSANFTHTVGANGF